MEISPAASALAAVKADPPVLPRPNVGVAPPQPASPAIAPTPPDSAVKSAEPSDQELVEAVQKLQSFVAPFASDLNFSIEKDLNRTVVKVIDRSNDEVIRQFPSEDALHISHEIARLQGLLLKEKG